MKITKQRLRQIIKEELEEAERQISFPVVSQADMDAAMATEQDVRKDLERAVMIAYEIDRNITPENTELMREIDDIMSRHGIEFEEDPEDEDPDVEPLVLPKVTPDVLKRMRQGIHRVNTTGRWDKK